MARKSDGKVQRPAGYPRGKPFVYLLHFDRPLHHARHYLGSTRDLAQRMADHQDGRGANLTGIIRNLGIGWTLVRVWHGGRQKERRLKRQKHGPRLCPICNPSA